MLFNSCCIQLNTYKIMADKKTRKTQKNDNIKYSRKKTVYENKYEILTKKHVYHNYLF